MGLPSRYKYINSKIDLTAACDTVFMDSTGESPGFSFSSSPSDNGNSNGASLGEGGAPSPAFHISSPEADFDDSLVLSLREPPATPTSVDVACLFSDLIASSSGANAAPMNSSGRKVTFMYKRKIGTDFSYFNRTRDEDCFADGLVADRNSPPCFDINPSSTNYKMYVMFKYGEPSAANRVSLWKKISDVILGLYSMVIIGDFNQVEMHSDKLGEMHSDKLGGSNSIRGQHEFTSWRLDNTLLDVPFFGSPFTWLRNRSDSKIIMERLDRAYANNDWLYLFPSASVLHLPILISDHAPIILKIFPSKRVRRRPYRLDNWWLSFPEISQLVLQAWQLQFTGSSMFVLSCRLAAVRYSIMQWVIQHRISHGINWSMVEEKLNVSASQIVDVESTISFQHDRSSHLQFLQTQHVYWLQRAKLKNEILDGLPSRFLFSRVKQRFARQRILAIRSRSGDWMDSPNEIASEITSYFQDIICTPPPTDPGFPKGFFIPLLSSLDLPSLTQTECSLLSVLFSEDDIVRDLRIMDESKSPGPDGITPKFFQIFWPQVGQLVTLAILRFLNTRVMLKEWNNTNIVLIPKIEKPALVSQYHPISLCSFIYPLTSRCIANRLKLVISSMVSDSQQAFVPDRLMTDGCLIAQEIMHYLHKNQESPNAPSDFKTHMTSFLIIKVVDCFGNYLGVPVDLPTKKMTAFHPLLDKMTTRIISWSALYLSQPCKLFIINAILIASIQHLMTATPLPLGFCRKIGYLITAFWWRKYMAHKSIHWLNCDSLQLRREKGGLCIKSVLLLSQASLMKNFRCIHHHPSGLLSRFLVPKYKKDLPVPGSKSKVSQPFFLWSGI
ncbi:uncharacterized protein LOC141590419 [Silene latifolia]|uniref:uncharacterized protein LOC141590419 n=1 Tax=Silene latifolia TaxID=37657 RepID=UPI003D77AD1D